MVHRPLVLVSGLTLGDFLLWHWSLNSSHDLLALVSGVTLVPLLLLVVWLLAKGIMRALVMRPQRHADGARSEATRRSPAGASSAAQAHVHAEANGEAPVRTGSAAAQQDSRRLAA